MKKCFLLSLVLISTVLTYAPTQAQPATVEPAHPVATSSASHTEAPKPHTTMAMYQVVTPAIDPVWHIIGGVLVTATICFGLVGGLMYKEMGKPNVIAK
ncbi:MAG: hypothetical protein SGI71_04250 [Verrucomicrobiota bacterium]|nr:hypothetical protein [Verrucomicrobiota bacterium]